MGKNALGWCLLFMLLGFQPLRVSTPWRPEQLGPIGYTSSLAESSKYGDTQAPPFTGASGASVAISQTPSLPVWKGRSGRRPGLLLPLSCLFSVSRYQMAPGCCTNSCTAVGGCVWAPSSLLTCVGPGPRRRDSWGISHPQISRTIVSPLPSLSHTFKIGFMKESYLLSKALQDYFYDEPPRGSLWLE